MMRSIKTWSVFSAMLIGLAAVLVSLGLLEMSRVPVQARTASEPVLWDLSAQPPPDFTLAAYFTDDLPIQVADLSGNVIGEGTHGGRIRCNGNTCSQKTELDIPISVISTLSLQVEYQYTTRQALDPVAERAVVAGKGTIFSRGQKERFSFTGIIQDNRDGTVSVTYVASRPDASFIIPRAPGRLRYTVQNSSGGRRL
jgi:hypothetical protein